MNLKLKHTLKITLLGVLFLTGAFSAPTFAQDKPSMPRAGAKLNLDELLEEPAPMPRAMPSEQNLKANSAAFLQTTRATGTLAAGDLDTSFLPNISNYPGSLRATAFQPDGKILLGGFFKFVQGFEHLNLVRLNANGSLDFSFTPKISDLVYAVAVQPDGKILIGGNFTRVNGVARNRIARLNADGSLDTSFDPAGGMDNTVYSISLQPDGKIFVGGFFTHVSTEERNNIVRLNANGSIDSTFNLFLDRNGFVLSTQLQPDGKILLGGVFSYPGNLASFSTIIRVDAGGSIDQFFNQNGASANSTVRDIKLQADGKILIGGNFTTYNDVARNRIARLNADGTLDTTFTHTSGANSSVYSITVLNTGKIVIGGFFTAYEGTGRNFIAQLETNGSLDTTFNPGTGFNGGVYEIVQLPSTQLLAGGNTTAYNNHGTDIAARINGNGSPDTNFQLMTLAPATIRATIIQPDGKIIVSGSFNISYGVNHNSIVRLNADGTNDPTFNAGTGTNSTIYTMALQTDGKILLGGTFTTYNGTTRNRIARINADGSLDSTFNPNADSSVSGIALQTDGKILVGGGFLNIAGAQQHGLARLNANGTRDTTFVFDSELAFVEGIGVQTDGKIVIGGIFNQVAGTPRYSVARINADGTLDSSFTPGLLPGGGVYSLAIQADGKILIGGNFLTLNSSTVQLGIARLNPNGTNDNSFQVGSGTGVNDDVEDIVVQSNGKILIGGSISEINGVAQNNLLRLNANGSIDASFNANVDGFVWDVNLDQNNPPRIVIGGDFGAVNNVGRSGVARLLADSGINRTPFDFDGDAKTDISIFRPSAGEWWINRSSTGQTVAAQFGAASDKVVAADYTGDGKADIAFWRPSTGEWFILRSENGSFLSFPFGASGDVPTAADFDGDGKADPTIFRPASNEWFIQKSTGGTQITTFGIAGDLPIAGDYDGDGKSDIAIYRPSAGEWWIQRSSNLSVYAFQFGTASDKPVQGDYTGDGKTDTAFWRPSTGEWFILRSEDSSFYSVPFGASGDLPTPGDYDGDGKFDTAVFRPSENNWYVNRSTAGLLIATFGIAGDKPLPNSFVP